MALGRAYIEIVGDVKRFGPDLRKGLAKAFKIGGIGTIAASASTQLVGLAASLAQVGGAAYALPAGIAVGAAAIGALRLATAGLGDAFKAAAGDDADAFAKAIEGLSPKAQQLAREFREVKPALDEIRDSAQDAFSGQLLGQIGQTAAVLSGPLRVGLARISAEYGIAARRALEFARESATASALSRVLESARVSVSNLTSATGALLSGFRDLAVVALPTIESLSASAGVAATKFGLWMSSVAESGQATAGLQAAMGVLRQLGQVAVNLGGILGSVFAAAREAAGEGGLLGNLVRVTGALNGFFQSAEGGGALTGLFTALGTVVSGLSPVLLDLLSAVGELVPALMPVAQSIVTAFQALTPALSPVAQLIASVATAAAPLLPIIAELAAAVIGPLAQALTPLAPLMGQVVAALSPLVATLGSALGPVILQIGQSLATALVPVIGVLAEVFRAVGPPLAQVVAALGATLGPILVALAPVLGQLVQTLATALVPVIGLLAEVFTQLGPTLGPVVAALGTALAPILAALAPVIGSVVDALLPLIPSIVALIPPVAEIVVALTPLIELAAQLAAVAIQVAGPLIKLVAVLAELLVSKAIAPLIGLIASGLAAVLSPLSKLTPLIQQFGQFLDGIDWGGIGSAIGGAFSKAWDAVAGFFADVGRWFSELPGKIGEFLASLPERMLAAFNAAFDAALHAIGVGIGLAIFTVSELPGMVFRVLASLPGRLASFFTSLWNTVSQLARRGIDAVVSFVTALPGRASNALRSLPGLLGRALTSAWNAAKSAAVSGANAVVNYISGVPGRISGLAGKFLSAGKNLIGKFMQGLKNLGSGVSNIASAISSAIKGFLNRVIGRINSGIADIDNVLPGSLPRIPYLANGAILRRPTLFVGGEAGDEVVIPLTRPRRARELAERSGLLRLLSEGGDPFLFGPGAISVTFSGVVPTEEEAYSTGRAVGRGVAATLARSHVMSEIRTL